MCLTASLTLSTKEGETESSSIPILRNVSVRLVSAASSPHIPIHAPFAWAFFADISMSRRIASWCVSTNCSTALFCLSQARVYCVRSLVPTLKKSTRGASLSLMTAAAGVSIIIPSSAFSSKSTPSARSSSLTSAHIFLICSTSDTLVIIGNMIPSLPNAEAL